MLLPLILLEHLAARARWLVTAQVPRLDDEVARLVAAEGARGAAGNQITHLRFENGSPRPFLENMK